MKFYEKNQNLFFCFVIVISITCFSTCKNDILLEPRIRIIVNSNYMSDTTIQVFVESDSGMSITGAWVYIQDLESNVTVLEYDSTKNSYLGTLDTSRNNSFFVYVDSVLFRNPKKYEITHEVLHEKPIITSFSDVLYLF